MEAARWAWLWMCATKRDFASPRRRMGALNRGMPGPRRQPPSAGQRQKSDDDQGPVIATNCRATSTGLSYSSQFRHTNKSRGKDGPSRNARETSCTHGLRLTGYGLGLLYACRPRGPSDSIPTASPQGRLDARYWFGLRPCRRGDSAERAGAFSSIPRWREAPS
jgi:hypothetical protein